VAAVCVRGAFASADIELARQAIDDNLASLSPLAKRASGTGDGAFIEDFCSWQRLAAMERFVRTSPAARLAGELMGAQQVRLYHDHVLVKEAGTRQRTPWHQDLPYYNVDGRLNISMWMPVDPVPRESTLEFVAGTHLGPWLMPRTFKDNQAKWFPEGTLSELPAVEADREPFPILGWALEPGDAVFFHMLTLHGSAGSQGRRRAFSVRFVGDDARHAMRPWRTSPPFDDLKPPLTNGATFDHPMFPLLIG
jgi:ectoine hydroxylase-related dioxygenase (phytanoyl-CoA dioxygenase family)